MQLTAERRAWLKAEVDRRRRAEIERQGERDRCLFTDEVAA